MIDPAFGEVCVEHSTGCTRCGGAITGRRTRWCTTACRLHYYKHHVWRYARRAAMTRAKRKCERCGNPAQEVDHIIERKGQPLSQWSCLHHQSNLRALCHDCHVTRKRWPEGDKWIGP